jgi:hypothetical protein
MGELVYHDLVVCFSKPTSCVYRTHQSLLYSKVNDRMNSYHSASAQMNRVLKFVIS